MSILTPESVQCALPVTIIISAITYFINPIHRKRVNIKQHVSVQDRSKSSDLQRNSKPSPLRIYIGYPQPPTNFRCRLSWNLGTSTSWNPLCQSRPVMELLDICPQPVKNLRHLNQQHIYALCLENWEVRSQTKNWYRQYSRIKYLPPMKSNPNHS